MFRAKNLCVSVFSTLVFLTLFAAPAVASADIQKSTLRATFVGTLSQSDRVDWVDQKFDEYKNEDGLNGHLAANDEHLWVVIEGLEDNIDAEIDQLSDDNSLESLSHVDTVYPETATLSGIDSHTELDTRDSASVSANTSDWARSHIRATFESGTSTSNKLSIVDNYFTNISSDEVGGAMVTGNGWEWIDIEIEGSESDVGYWIDQLRGDPNFESVQILNTSYPDGQSFYELITHTHNDARESYSRGSY